VPTVGKVFTVTVTARNNGKTFARDFQSRVIINIVEKDAEPAFALGRQTAAKAHGRSSVSVLPPTGEYSTSTDVDPDGKPGPITQEIFDNLSSGRIKLFSAMKCCRAVCQEHSNGEPTRHITTPM
jgi:hypothetical protein